MSLAKAYTFDTTYALVLSDDNGGWNYVSQAEYTTEDEIHETARHMYGGLGPDDYGVVEISRRVLPGRAR